MKCRKNGKIQGSLNIVYREQIPSKGPCDTLDWGGTRKSQKEQ